MNRAEAIEYIYCCVLDPELATVYRCSVLTTVVTEQEEKEEEEKEQEEKESSKSLHCLKSTLDGVTPNSQKGD